jgi:hypothetical protein
MEHFFAISRKYLAVLFIYLLYYKSHLLSAWSLVQTVSYKVACGHRCFVAPDRVVLMTTMARHLLHAGDTFLRSGAIFQEMATFRSKN